MSRFNTRRNLTSRQVTKRIFALVVAVAIVAFFMPRTSQHVHDYRLGEPWDDEAVIAEDSFPVMKPEAMLAQERDSLRRYYSPYYFEDDQIENSNLAKLGEFFANKENRHIPHYYLKHLQEKLLHVYDKGIIDSEEWDRLNNSPSQSMHIYSQRTSREVSLDDVYTTKVAYEFMMYEEDSIHYQHNILAQCNLQDFLTPNLIYDEEKSLQQQEEVNNSLLPYMGKPVLVGQKIVDYGQIVDVYTYQALKSLEELKAQKHISQSQQWFFLIGQTLFTVIIILLIFFYFHQFRSDYACSGRAMSLIVTLSLIFVLTTFFIIQHDWDCVLVVPYCILPIFVRIFMDSRTAFITHMFVIMACAVSMNNPYEFILVELAAGLTAIYSMRQLSQRSELFRATVALTLCTLLCRLALDLIGGRLENMEDINFTPYIQLIAAGCLTLIAYLLLIPIERIFGFTSMVTLIEMSNFNSPLLRALSEKAPGTFQHSMQVANLAAEAANAIGAQSQLVRTGALYHDMGKLSNPEFFTENQEHINPHEGMSPKESAALIISHIEKGIQLANKYQLPEVICDFIRTHHGRGVARYFFITYQNQHAGEVVDSAPFTYPGPDPFTAEQAIVMMADSVEAASRSLTEYTEENIAQVVEKIVDGLFKEGRFKRCPISLRDIDDIKQVFCKKLQTIYHSRIQYPELKK